MDNQFYYSYNIQKISAYTNTHLDSNTDIPSNILGYIRINEATKQHKLWLECISLFLSDEFTLVT